MGCERTAMINLITSKKFLAALCGVVFLLVLRPHLFGSHDSTSTEAELLARFQYEGALFRMRERVSRLSNHVVVSVVVPCYDQVDTLRRTLDSITNQPDFPFYEIVVVNDGSPDSTDFYEFARKYQQEMPHGVAIVNITPEDVVPQRPAKPLPQAVYFVSKRNGGLGSARNFGIDLASGKWIMALDSDDLVASDFFQAVLTELALRGLDLVEPGTINVISTNMATLDGTPLGWQPLDIRSIDIRKQNAFHCSALFLRSIVSEHHIRYRPVLAWGWEDWDFWIQTHDKVGINALYVRAPVFLYSSAGGHGKKEHMASFCSTHNPFCKAVLVITNSRLYNEKTLKDSVEVLTGKKGGFTDNSVKVGQAKSAQWRHMKGEAEKSSPEPSALFLLALADMATDRQQTLALLKQIMDMRCDANGVDRSVSLLLQQSFTKKDIEATWKSATMPKPAVKCDNVLFSRILQNDPECDMARGGFQALR